ncbi:MAG: type IV pilus assembly protein PilM [Patescibacteria group bacterium]
MNIVGLDLGIHSIKAVELKKEKGKNELNKYGILEKLVPSLSSDQEDEIARYSKALSDFYDEHNFSTRSVIVALPETSVFTRVIKVPKMSEKDLKSAINYEAEQYIPVPLKDVNFDFQIIEDDTNDKNSMSVILVAATKILISKYVKVLKNSKLSTVGMEPETLAIARVVGDTKEQPNPSIVVSIAASETNIIITHKGIVRFTRNISTGGDALTRAVSQNLGFDFSQGEEYKKTYGIDPNQVDGKVFNAIKPVFDIVLDEIKRAYFFYTTHNPGVNMRRVVVCGGTALMPGLLYYLTTNLSIEVELGNPYTNITFSSKLQKEKQSLLDRGPFFVTALGLAMKDL